MEKDGQVTQLFDGAGRDMDWSGAFLCVGVVSYDVADVVDIKLPKK